MVGGLEKTALKLNLLYAMPKTYRQNTYLIRRTKRHKDYLWSRWFSNLIWDIEERTLEIKIDLKKRVMSNQKIYLVKKAERTGLVNSFHCSNTSVNIFLFAKNFSHKIQLSHPSNIPVLKCSLQLFQLYNRFFSPLHPRNINIGYPNLKKIEVTMNFYKLHCFI